MMYYYHQQHLGIYPDGGENQQPTIPVSTTQQHQQQPNQLQHRTEPINIM